MRKHNSLSLFTIVQLILSSFLYSCSGVTVETKDNFDAIDLPDGSTVYMNHNSSVEYDQNFEPRKVRVDGEIFFTVVNGQSPFIISTQLGEIKVIGTEFNVKSSKESLEVEVEEGKVEVNTSKAKKEVKHGFKALIKKGDNLIQQEKGNFKFKIWMNQLKIEFKKLGREIKYGAKEVGKESKKIGNKFKKELKQLKPQ